MFCMSCGTQLPNDAKFCYKCGTAQTMVGKSFPQPPTDSFLRSLPEEKKRQLLTGEHNIILNPREEYLDYLMELAEKGPITNDVIDDAITFLKSLKCLGPVSDHHALMYFTYIRDVAQFFKQRWFLGQDKPSKNVNKNLLIDDWQRYLQWSFGDFLFYTYTVDKTMGLRIHLLSYNQSLSNWLEDELISNALLALNLNNINISEDDLKIAEGKVGIYRFNKIIEAISRFQKR